PLRAVAPTTDLAGLEHGAGMEVARRDLPHGPADVDVADRCRRLVDSHRARVTVAELAVRVVAPTANLAVGEENAVVLGARRDREDGSLGRRHLGGRAARDAR